MFIGAKEVVLIGIGVAVFYVFRGGVGGIFGIWGRKRFWVFGTFFIFFKLS